MVDSGLTDSTIYSLAVSGTGVLFAGTAYGGVFRSSNNGTSWTEVNTGITDSTIYTLAVSSAGNVFAGSDVQGVFRSSNNGTSWTMVNAGIGDSSVQALTISSNGALYVGTYYGYIFRSTNEGTNWTVVDTNSSDSTIYSLAASGNTIFAVTNNGIIVSVNSGTSWAAFDSGLTNSGSITSLALSGNYLFAGTYDGGIWRRSLSNLIGVIEHNPAPRVSLPVDFTMNVPGHKNPRATIAFSLARFELVTVKIYTLSGHEVATPVDGYFAAGRHGLTWDTEKLAAGSYTVRMQAGQKSVVKSFMMGR